MRAMNIITITSSLFLLFSCYGFEDLGMGGGKTYQFDCTRGQLQSCLDSFKIRHPEYEIPYKLKKWDFWDVAGYGELSGVVFYFSRQKDFHEDLYYVTLIKDKLKDTIYTKPSYVAVRSVLRLNQKDKWPDVNKLDKSEQEIIEKRFRTEVLEKINLDPCGCQLKGVQVRN
ncbi:MAG: hypothetical protein J7604_25990 [Sporocytophaga sp.]|uniref:hypothetical protein n=1 Tax=Sporocytophaga sp. TaxID=2231183 RepID=UPI001B142CCB|nr:hypothetical protein [Sporocytophaga sp.]MBO9703683.1 hypothetical protein [Sporocytophaga sp.]